MKAIWKFLKDEDGLELVEYAVMGALIVAALVTAIGLMSGAIQTKFGQITTVIGASSAP